MPPAGTALLSSLSLAALSTPEDILSVCCGADTALPSFHHFYIPISLTSEKEPWASSDSG